MNLDYFNRYESVPPQFEGESSSLCFLSICSDQTNAQPPLRERVNGLISQLDSEVFTEREEADASLRGMDRNILPFLERELTNPRSVEVRQRLLNIYRAVSGSENIRFNGDRGTDGVGRLREVRNNMSVSFRDGPFPSRTNEVDSIGYERAGGWYIVRQGDGTYNIGQRDNDGKPMETGARITLDQATGNVRAVLRDGSAMIIPPAGPRWWYREGSEAPPVPDN